MNPETCIAFIHMLQAILREGENIINTKKLFECWQDASPGQDAEQFKVLITWAVQKKQIEMIGSEKLWKILLKAPKEAQKEINIQQHLDRMAKQRREVAKRKAEKAVKHQAWLDEQRIKKRKA